MMKKILLFALCALMLFPAPAGPEEPLRRGLFVSVIQDPCVLSSRKDIKKLIAFARKSRINILFVQVYRANQAWFASSAADCSPYRTCLKSVSEDPLKLLIKEAHAAGIKVHAWLNMLSLSRNKEAALLKKYGPDILTRNMKEKRLIEDFEIDNQYFLEPGDMRVRGDLLDIVEGLIRGYPELDGIQFDYIRYPDKDPAYGFTKMNIERFKAATGLGVIDEAGFLWKDWKRAQVTAFLEELIERTRLVRPDILISTTGCAPYSRAYHEAFQDWRSWLERGMVDFVTVMAYSPDAAEFEEYMLDIRKNIADPRKVNIAIGVYDMVGRPQALTREFELCGRYGMENCVIFHYGSLLEDPHLGNLIANRWKPRR